MEEFVNHEEVKSEENKQKLETMKTNDQSKKQDNKFKKIVALVLENLIAAKDVALKMIISPVTVLKKEIETSSFSVGITLIIIYALICGCYTFTIGSLLRSNILGYFGLSFPYFKVFLYLVILGFLKAGILIGSIYIFNQILKSNKSCKRITAMVGIVLVPEIIVGIIAVITGFLFVKLAICLLLFAIILHSILLFVGIKKLLSLSENKAIYVGSGIVVINLIVVLTYIVNSVLR